MKEKLINGFLNVKDLANGILANTRVRQGTLVVLFLILCYFFGGGIAILTNASIPSRTIRHGQNWGLGFGKEGEKPRGNATVDELKRYNAYYMDETNDKVIYLTFDAGFENGCTPKILDALKKHQVPATFFLVGNYIETSKDLVMRMVEEGHIVANHTYSHPDMSKISSLESFKKELEDLELEYKKVTGQEMKKYYRPPQGIYSEENLKMANELGYTTFFWSLAYVDWYVDKQPSKEEAFKKLLGRIHPGAIVLLHSTSETNAEILDELLGKWKEMGYEFASLDELVNKYNR
ncbi:MAG: delta-lactam-biosynthetic de-N-acetylase [Clostridiales bacterium]|nr:delta-lactam-biosynthetic de-N-acetylase [Clostridiales bacterium]